MAKVSVIIPNYNHAKYLRQRIDSVLNQTYKDFELIILDDCSSDNSRTIIDEYVARIPGIKNYYNNSNSGNPFKQWDFGVNKANGDFIWIAESDDFADPVFLHRATEILDNQKNVGLVYCNSTVIDEQNNTEYVASAMKKYLHLDPDKWMHDYLNNGKNEISDSLFLNNTINNVSGVLFRKDKYAEAGYADHSMKYCGDWFLYLRILLISDIAYISSPLNSLRIHGESSCHYYYRKSTYLSEFLRIYIFILTKRNLNIKKRYKMIKCTLRIIYRKLTYKHIPGFNEIIGIFKFLISVTKFSKPL